MALLLKNNNQLKLDTYSEYRFALPPFRVPASTLSIKKCFIYEHGIPHNIASDQWIHFIATEVWKWAQDQGIHWPYHTPLHSEAARLTENWNGLLETQLKHQLRGNTLRMGCHSPTHSTHIESRTFIVYYVLCTFVCLQWEDIILIN